MVISLLLNTNNVLEDIPETNIPGRQQIILAWATLYLSSDMINMAGGMGRWQIAFDLSWFNGNILLHAWVLRALHLSTVVGDHGDCPLSYATSTTDLSECSWAWAPLGPFSGPFALCS